MDMPAHLTVENTVHQGILAIVFCDGVQIDGAVEAHTVEGWIDRVVYDENGEMKLTGDRANPEVLKERVTGIVTAEFRPIV